MCHYKTKPNREEGDRRHHDVDQREEGETQFSKLLGCFVLILSFVEGFFQQQSKNMMMIRSLCKLGRLKEALQSLYSNPTSSSSSSNSATAAAAYSSVLQLCIDSNAKQEGLSLQTHLTAIGYSPDLHLSTKFIIFHSKVTADLASARKMFDSMPQRSIVSWTAMISGYAQNGYSEDALHLFSLMRCCSGFSPNQFTFGAALSACARVGAFRIGQKIQGCIEKSRFFRDIFVQSALLDLHLKCGSLEDARCLFQRMEMRDAISWNLVIGGHAVRGLGDDALGLFCSMLRDGNSHYVFLTFFLSLICDAACLDRQSDNLIEKLDGYNHVITFMSAYLQFNIVYMMFIEHYKLHSSTFVSVLNLCNPFLYTISGFLPDHFTFASALKAYSCTKTLSNVNQTHTFVIKSGYENHNVVTGSLIDAYAKCGRIDKAKIVYDSMLKHDLISCTALINSYSSERFSYREALNLFREINRTCMVLDDVILCSMINLCANVTSLSLGRQIHACALKKQPLLDVAFGNSLIDMYAKTGELEDAHQAFDEMKDKNVISWTSLITSYGKHGYGEGAITLFLKMEESGVRPNDVTFLSLLFACSHSGLITKGINFLSLMVSKYHIRPRVEHYSCVTDLLARGGLLEEAYDFACNMDAMPNLSLWGSLLGSCSIYGNTSLGRIAASNLFQLDPERSVSYVVLANIYAAAGLWEDAKKIRKFIEERSVKKIVGCSFIWL
ncbi:pentatricopeptide repeat-containing protein At3g20730-like [Asparagus officinalis]|uniref:pentatricopeptide repeat-containing protein At3g20730-like n=1 Tax=Asparagus officinalis TaxID=4686 RepID=UPI00098E814F|nr:pentatricopeptide repeat-containing protein At3g20730-like [Asparagus officinalis]